MKYTVLKSFPLSRDGIRSEQLIKGDIAEIPDELVDGLEAEGFIASDAQRSDGPTVADYVAAGYLASNYPPEGYASRSTPEEIAAAIEAEKAKANEEAMKAELAEMTVAQLRELAKAENVAIEGDDNKAEIVAKIAAARMAVTA